MIKDHVHTASSTNAHNINILRQIKKYIIGGILLVINVLCYIYYSYTIQYINDKYNNIYFIRYISISSHLLSIIPYYITRKLEMKDILNDDKRMKRRSTTNDDKSSFLYTREFSLDADKSNIVVMDDQQPKDIRNDDRGTNINVGLIKILIFPSILLGILYFIQGYLWYISLQNMTLTANNSVSQIYSVFILLLSVIILDTKLTCLQIIGVILSSLGAFLISFYTNTYNTTKGYNITINDLKGYVPLFSAIILYSLYFVIQKHYINKYLHKLSDTFLFQTIISSTIILIFWIGIIILNFTNIEPFNLPSNISDIKHSIIYPFISELTLILTFKLTIHTTNERFTFISSLIIIPLTYIYDITINDIKIEVQTIVGMSLLIIGVLMSQIDRRDNTSSIPSMNNDQYHKIQDRPISL